METHTCKSSNIGEKFVLLSRCLHSLLRERASDYTDLQSQRQNLHTVIGIGMFAFHICHMIGCCMNCISNLFLAFSLLSGSRFGGVALGARSIQPTFQPVRLGKEDHLKRWTRFFETFPVGPNRSIEFWTEISGKFG